MAAQGERRSHALADGAPQRRIALRGNVAQGGRHRLIRPAIKAAADSKRRCFAAPVLAVTFCLRVPRAQP